MRGMGSGRGRRNFSKSFFSPFPQNSRPNYALQLVSTSRLISERVPQRMGA